MADVARQVEAELKEKTRLQTQEHQDRLTQLASETERILSLEKELAELTLQHGRELERVTEQHTEELRELEDRVRARERERVLPGCDSHMLSKQSHIYKEKTCSVIGDSHMKSARALLIHRHCFTIFLKMYFLSLN